MAAERLPGVLKFGWLAVAPWALMAQTFEVASIKPSAPDAIGISFNFTPGEGLIVKNSPLRGIIESAYDVRDFQIQGGPAWMNSERYDIFAKSESGDAQPGHPTPASVGRTRVKLQALLAGRFQLQVHRETRELPIYALEVGKNGPKFAEAAAAPEGSPAGVNSGCGRMTGTNTPMENLARVLSRVLARPVEDRTGLTAKYSFQFEWTPDAGPCEESAPDRPSIFGALQEQLGLKLESTRGPVEIVVVDRAEKQAAN